MIFGSVWIGLAIAGGAARAEDLINPPKDMSAYELSNLRTEKGVFGEEIAFDYKRTRDGKGRPQLAARTDTGSSRIMGLPISIEATGTIRLRDIFSRSRSVLMGGREFGIEFYIVADQPPGFGVPKRFLVSNSVVHGKMNTRVQSRAATAEELKEIEMQRIASVPPETVPEGYVRVAVATPLVAGAPILYGTVGQWKPATVVDVSSPSVIRFQPEDSKKIQSLARQDWTAVSEATLKEIEADPSQFSSDVRLLPGGSLVLDEGMQPLDSAMELLTGTPLLREQGGQWQDLYLISSDNVSVRVLVRQSGKPKVEFVPLKNVAIREATILDQKNESAKAAFAANIADFQQGTAAGSGAGSGAMAGSLSGGGGLSGSGSSVSFGSSPAADASASASPSSPPSSSPSSPPAPIRGWSDQSGRFEIQARLIEQDESEVLLKREDGRTVKVPIDKLSEADRQYLNESKMEADNPFNRFVDPPSGPTVNYAQPLMTVAKVGDLRWGSKSVAISPDNRLLMIGRKGSAASLCELQTGKTLVDSGRMDHMGDIGVCGFTADGRHLLLGGYKGVFEVYQPDSKGMLKLAGQHTLHEKDITALSLSLDGKYALSGGADKLARYWEIETGSPVATLDGFSGQVKATRITASGKHLMATDGKTIKRFSVEEGKVVDEWEVGRSHASGQAAAFSHDGKTLAVGDGYKIDLWDLTTQQKLGTLEHDAISWSMVFTPDNQTLLCGGNGVIDVWDWGRQAKVQTNTIGKNFYVQALAVSPDGTRVAAPADHNSVVVLATP